MAALRQLVFASHNENKKKEIALQLGPDWQLLSLDDIGCLEDIDETGATLTENAQIKPRYVANKYQIDCFADDTGLEVDALNGAPGVKSARYAGEGKNSDDNIEKLLSELGNNLNRKARFKTVICLIINNEEYIFEGKVEGEIRKKRSGTAGFGYDPVFEPENQGVTFAEMNAEDKNAISHRGRAIAQLIQWLQDNKS
jgi:XTP/dITP diphosphohydrolase